MFRIRFGLAGFCEHVSTDADCDPLNATSCPWNVSGVAQCLKSVSITCDWGHSYDSGVHYALAGVAEQKVFFRISSPGDLARISFMMHLTFSVCTYSKLRVVKVASSEVSILSTISDCSLTILSMGRVYEDHELHFLFSNLCRAMMPCPMHATAFVNGGPSYLNSGTSKYIVVFLFNLYPFFRWLVRVF